jgi:hypothetical protein
LSGLLLKNTNADKGKLYPKGCFVKSITTVVRLPALPENQCSFAIKNTTGSFVKKPNYGSHVANSSRIPMQIRKNTRKAVSLKAILKTRKAVS